ncbi:MAG TPA: pyridoxamine 5'-phosphate oxidase family protein [Gemmatimonadaceae bacterium]
MGSSKNVSPKFAELTEHASRTLLSSKHVGRIAYTLHDRVDIQPVSYMYDDGWIFGRTRVGTKLEKLAHNPWCAFEVDEARGPFDWDSVVAHGSFHLLDPESGSADVYERALRRLHELIPGTFDVDDPAPERTILFGVWVQELTGRSARS